MRIKIVMWIPLRPSKRSMAVGGLSGGSAYLTNQLGSGDRNSSLQELFRTGDNSIADSYLRISIGSSHFSASVFSYDDMPAGQADGNLDHFNLSETPGGKKLFNGRMSKK